MTCDAHALAKSRRMLVEEDVDLIIYAAEQLPKERTVYAVDLGFGESGTSTLAVFAGRGEDIKVIGIDPQIHWGSLAVVNIGQADRFQAMVNSADEVPMDEIGPIDLLLVDCLPDETKKVLRTWLPKLQPDGYVWVHDYGDPKEHGEPFSRYEKNKTVSRDISSLVDEGLMTEVKVAGLGWLGRLASETSSGTFSKLPDEEIAKQSEEAAPLSEVSEPSSESIEPLESTPQDESAQQPKVPFRKKTGRPRGSKNKPKE